MVFAVGFFFEGISGFGHGSVSASLHIFQSAKKFLLLSNKTNLLWIIKSHFSIS
jgi:hypothetical protein